MSIGHPGESEETIAETKRWLIEEKPADFDCTIITPYPGSPYYDDAECDGKNWVYSARNGDLQYQSEVDYAVEADFYKGNPDDGYVSHVWTPSISRVDLVRMRNDLEQTVRAILDIPFNPSAAAQQFEATMGQTKLPPRILRKSHATPQESDQDASARA